jgi:hypothetical protein
MWRNEIMVPFVGWMREVIICLCKKPPHLYLHIVERKASRETGFLRP